MSGNCIGVWRLRALSKKSLKSFIILITLILPLLLSSPTPFYAKQVDITYPIQVLFDESHNQTFTSQNFESFLEALRSELEFSVDINTGNLTLNALRNYDIVIIPVPSKNFTEAEVDALNVFLFNWSRSLLILGDSNPNVSYLNSITSLFGFKFIKNTVCRYNSFEVHITKDMFQNNSLTYNIESLTYVGCGLNVLEESSQEFYNYIIVWGDENTFLDLNENYEQDAGEPSGKSIIMVIGTELDSGGRIITIGSTKMFINDYWSSDNNSIFAINVMKWLAKFPQPYLEDAYISWIISCQWLKDPSETVRYGGFAINPKSNLVNMLSTYAAVRFLNSTNSLNRILNETALIEFVKNSQYLVNSSDERYGGFGGYPGDLDVKCGYTGMAIYILKVLNRLDVINLTAAVHFLSSHQKKDPSDIRNYGGFYEPSKVNATIEETYWAIYGLYLVDSLSNVNTTSCVQWIIQSQYLENSTHINYGAFLSRPRKSPDDIFIVHSYLAVSTLKILNGLNEIRNKTALISWVKKLYNSSVNLPEYFGGFFERPGGLVRASATYMAVNILSIFDENFNRTASIDYLSKCQNLDGGFGDGVTVKAIASTLGGYYGVMGDPSVSVEGIEQLKLRLRVIVSIPKKIYSGDKVRINVQVTDLQNVAVSNLSIKIYINGNLIRTVTTNGSGFCMVVWSAGTPGTYTLRVYVFGGKYYSDVVVEGTFKVTGFFNVNVQGLPGATFMGRELNITVIVKDNFSGKPVENADVSVIIANRTYLLQPIGEGRYQTKITIEDLKGKIDVEIVVKHEYYETWRKTYILVVYQLPLTMWIYLLIFAAIGGVILYIKRKKGKTLASA